MSSDALEVADEWIDAVRQFVSQGGGLIVDTFVRK